MQMNSQTHAKTIVHNMTMTICIKTAMQHVVSNAVKLCRNVVIENP